MENTKLKFSCEKSSNIKEAVKPAEATIGNNRIGDTTLKIHEGYANSKKL